MTWATIIRLVHIERRLHPVAALFAWAILVAVLGWIGVPLIAFWRGM